MDIDAILERAETREAEDNGGAGEELLSQFKVSVIINNNNNNNNNSRLLYSAFYT